MTRGHSAASRPRHGVTDWIGARAGTAWRELGRHSKLLPPEYERSLRANEITFAEVFRRAGYRSFFAGKWHLGDTGAEPEDFGFQINKGRWRVGLAATGGAAGRSPISGCSFHLQNGPYARVR